MFLRKFQTMLPAFRLCFAAEGEGKPPDVLESAAGGTGEKSGKERGGGKSLTCEFCDCKLTADGEIIRMGAKAKTYRDSEDQIAKLSEKVTKLETELAALKAPKGAEGSAVVERFKV